MITVAIIGLGLMGGSLALALKQASGLHLAQSAGPGQTADGEEITPTSCRIVGIARRRETLAAAQAAGAIDDGTTDLAAGVAEADMVVLATPVRTILRQLPEVGRHARPGALVLDLGSTKAAICEAMASLPPGLEPVGGHPMCGKEVAGFEAADGLLFRDRPFVLCPLPRTSDAALARALDLARAVGGRPMILDPVAHDGAVAGISHLPYAVAAALAETVAAPAGGSVRAGDDLLRSLAASGFRDTTRLAASDVDMMLDILLTNREALLAWLDAFGRRLAELRAALAAGDEASLRTQLTLARSYRSGLKI